MTRLKADFVEREYNLRAAFPDHPQWFARWAAESAAARARLAARLDLRYGSGPKQTIDLFPAENARGALLFVHGGYWRALDKNDFSWTRGQPAAFRSSTIAERDYCRDCGTPLSFRRIDGPRIEIMTGSFDRPDRLVPTRQFGTESRLGWVVGISNLPSQTTMQNYGPDKMATITSHQHPDHD